jgi:putative iron-regulated protein
MAMAKRAKIWTALGVAVLAGTGAAEAGMFQPNQLVTNSHLFLVDGEGGGEGSGYDGSTTYALQSTDPKAYEYDATAQIEAYVDLVQKSYQKSADDAAALEASVDGLLANPSQVTLDAARRAWIAARPAYLRTEAFRFYSGPIDRVEGEINSWPVNEAYIDYVDGKANAGLINDPKVKLDVDFLESVNQKQDEADVTIGWHAVEFLLWGQDLSVEGPGNRPFADYVAGHLNNDRRRSYLKLVTSHLTKELAELAAEWDASNAKSYGAEFKKFPQREAIGRIVNGMAILAGYEFMSERLAVALDSGDQEDEQSCFSDTTKQDFVNDLEGIKAVWTKARIVDLVAAQDVALAKKVDALFADAETKIAALGDPWDQVLVSPKDSASRRAAEAVVVALQSLGAGLKEVGNKLGVLVLIPTE